MGLLKEFKDFAVKGNAMDLAVGVIIGAAFGKIVSALVDNIFMPVINPLIPGGDWRSIMLGPMKVGAFGGAVLDFLIIAFVIFLVVKGINSMKKESVAIVTEPTPTEKLLAEIRDELRKK
jgi:large conductance mechanosensitive channel